MNQFARPFRVVFALCLAAIGTFQGVIASPHASPTGSQAFITTAASALAGEQSAAAPAELHEYYGTLTFEDGQQFTGGPSIQPGQMFYMDALGTQELMKLQSTGEDTMAGSGSGPNVKWSRDAQGRLIAAEFVHDDGRKRTARFKGPSC
jgi:D-serine deaminase-like pyridoxal phosphate-dependent protein